MIIKGHGRLVVKDADKGEVESVIATLNVEDLDGDVILPGSIGTQDVAMLRSHAWDSWPIGKGVLAERDSEAVFTGRFNLASIDGREGFESVKFQDDLQEWSFGFRVLPGGASVGEWNGKNVNLFRPLPDGSPGLKVYEVSPVLVGAGIGTRTVAVKGLDPLGTGPISDQVVSVLAAVDDLIDRYTSLADLRAESGRTLSKAHLERIDGLVARLTAIKADTLRPDDAVVLEAVRFEQLRSRLASA